MKPLSREFLINRGKCCGNGCLNCPYVPKHKRNNIKIIMSEKDFINWLKGYLESHLNRQISLTSDDIKTILNKAEQIIVFPEFLPFPEPSCKFPNDCGMPQVWHGVIPPICGKCGFQVKILM